MEVNQRSASSRLGKHVRYSSQILGMAVFIAVKSVSCIGILVLFACQGARGTEVQVVPTGLDRAIKRQ